MRWKRNEVRNVPVPDWHRGQSEPASGAGMTVSDAWIVRPAEASGMARSCAARIACGRNRVQRFTRGPWRGEDGAQ